MNFRNSETKKQTWRRLLLQTTLPVIAIGVLALGGCGSSGSDNGTQASAMTGSGSPGPAFTVNESPDQSGALTTAGGRTLYVSDQENGKVLCKSSDCTAVWIPLTVKKGQDPTAPDQLSGQLGTIKRPDGATQATLDGKPLYTFALDQKAGETGGNGESDSFDGTDFTWQAATANGSGAAPSMPAPTGGGGRYSY